MSVTLELIETLADRENLAAELWDFHRRASGSFFINPAWVSAFQRALAKDNPMYYITGRDDGGHIIGHMPVWIAKRRFLRLFQPRVLALAGTCSAVSPEHLDVTVAPEYTGEWFNSVAGALAEKKPEYDFIIFESTAESAPNLQEIIGGLDNLGYRVVRRIQDTCLYLKLSDSFDGLLDGYSANMRKIIRRTMRRGEGKFQVVDYGEIGSFEKAFAEARRLHRLSRSKKGEAGSFDRPGYVEFHQALAEYLIPQGSLYFVFLMDGDHPVSFRYGFLDNGVYYDYQTGYDPAYAEHRPGFLILALAIRDLIERGIMEVDFLRGDEPYKRHWTDTERKTYRYYLFPPGGKGGLYYRLLQLYGSVR